MLCGPEFSPERDRDTGEASALAAECLQSCSPPEHLQPPPYLPVRPRGQLHGKRQGRSREEAGCSLDGFQAFDSFAVRQSPGLGACRGLESRFFHWVTGQQESVLGVGCEGRRPFLPSGPRHLLDVRGGEGRRSAKILPQPDASPEYPSYKQGLLKTCSAHSSGTELEKVQINIQPR